MTCPDCGCRLDEVPVDDSCPACGGARRDAVAFAQVAGTVTSVGQVTIDVRYNSHRPWQQKWREVQRLLADLEDAYQPPGSGNEHVRLTIEGLFKACRELADWLKHDAGTDAINFVNANPDLRLCDGFAQTAKHHTRYGTDPLTVRIAGIRSGPTGARSRIEWSRPNGVTGTDDALALARRCVRAWEGYFTRHRLDPTS
jgi:hypothetical protein